MVELSSARCFHHPVREAVVRCTSCGRFFCRECVTEHHERFLCGECLAAGPADASRDRRRVTAVLRGLLGLLFLWGCFYWFGKGLLLIPTRFHDGTAFQAEGER
jgi:hypothetical protein